MILFPLESYCSLKRPKVFAVSKYGLLLLFACGWLFSQSQDRIILADLSSFQNPSTGWGMAGSVYFDPYGNDGLIVSKGTGVIVNSPGKRDKRTNLISSLQHGDIDIEMDYLLTKGSNSGIFLQGRYEIQLADSWKVLQPKYKDNGGINERWDDKRPQGQNGYDGHPPRQNVSRAPGLWQHLKISFQAPRFNESGRKIENAKILSAILNGVVIHENVVLSGPTYGALSNEEVAAGPLFLQSDQGEIAFRNIQVTHFGKPRPEIVNLTYEVYKGKYEEEPDYKKLPPEAKGNTDFLTSDVNNIPNEFLLRFSGTLRVKEPGEYIFNMNAPGGRGYLKINNQVVVPYGESGENRHVKLSAGDIPFEILYAKFTSYVKSAIGMMVSGPGIREFRLSDGGISLTNEVDPILVQAPVNTLLRSFIDLPIGIRIMHGINVGSPAQVHYTYDMDNAAIVQLWRGGFLDATPMWVGRGDGSARATGSLLFFGKPEINIARLSSTDANWNDDTTGTGYRPKGYLLDKSNHPTFRYLIYGTNVTDDIRVIEGGDGISREINIENPISDLYVRLAANENIKKLSNELYLIGDNSYYIRVEGDGAKPILRDVPGGKELIAPAKDRLIYSLLF